MSIVDKKYNHIAPQLTYLKDKVILAQAWKKTHSYIRRHNWYEDVLELDCSTIDLENRLTYWASLLENDEYLAMEMRLVLAPKNSRWYFSENKVDKLFDSWSPRRNGNQGKKREQKLEQKLRPLAHLNIRDQTVSTALMICLADAVETAQGPTDIDDFLTAQFQKVYSYGNRLHCNWEYHTNKRMRARFNWGNSRCYRQYYDDYKLFLQRPLSICQHYSSIAAPSNNLFIISLDLKEFFDNIDINALIFELKRIYQNYISEFNLSQDLHDQEDFWARTTKIFSWTWAKQDLEWGKTMLNGHLPTGIPQGLVASGFLSNAYLVGFDNLVGFKINTDIISNRSFIIRDYCRYVDDVRLVVECSENNAKEVKQIVETWFSEWLKEYQSNINASQQITLNNDKTKVIPYRQLSSQSKVSSLMNMFQNVLSGTPDEDSLRQAAGGLDGLLRMADQLESDDEDEENYLDLSKISTPHIDVRDDTLKRFAATRIVKSLRLRRSMTDINEPLGKVEPLQDRITSGQLLDHEFEAAARKLVAGWAANPSITLLLRCGLDLYPDPTILVPVIDALKTKLYELPTSDRIYVNEMKTAEYVSADLLRAGAKDIGYRSKSNYPDSADIDGFREELAVFAKELLMERQESPWYLKQQAVLFLISVGDYGFTIKEDEKELRHYMLLHEAVLFRSSLNVDLLERLAVSLVAQQLNCNPKKYASWFIEWMNKQTSKDRKQALKIVFMNRPDLMKEIVISNRMRTAKWTGEISNEIKNIIKIDKSNDFILNSGNRHSLLRVIQSNSNPFKQENALLLLARAILRRQDAESILSAGVSVNDLMVLCRDWGSIQNPSLTNKFLWVSYATRTHSDSFRIPDWISEKHKWMYALGRILRSCITGEYDFTAHSFLAREDHGSYKGLKSTWFTRRFGLNNHPKGLSCESSPISPWLTELLFRLLQWPGINQWGELVKEFDRVLHPEDLLKLIDDRLAYQAKIFGRLSDTPFYVIPTPTQKSRNDGKLHIAVVQPLLPRMADFNVKDPTSWTASFRAIHRNHIASICNLVNRHLKAKRSGQLTGKIKTDSNKEKDIDLIVFPELTIHPDDIDLLRGLSDATKANIFTGLTFIRLNDSSRPVNQALWLLRAERPTGREFMYIYQGKQHMTNPEKEMGVQSYRPYQVIIEMNNGNKVFTRIAGSICYDATDLSLAADLRGVSDIFVIAAMNKDIQTFDNMVAALHYHMYQPVILANTGEFGGSTAQAPFTKHAKDIAHVHGNQQVAISIFEVDVSVFKSNIPSNSSMPEVKTPPAGYEGRH